MEGCWGCELDEESRRRRAEASSLIDVIFTWIRDTGSHVAIDVTVTLSSFTPETTTMILLNVATCDVYGCRSVSLYEDEEGEAKDGNLIEELSYDP